MNADWDDLRVFLTLAREGSLTAAARRLERQPSDGGAAGQGAGGDASARGCSTACPTASCSTSAGEGLLGDAQAMERAAESIHRRSAGLTDTVARHRAALGRRGDGRLHRAPSAAAAPPAAMHRVRADGQPHAGQPVAPRGRSPDPRAGARSRPASSPAGSAGWPMRSMAPLGAAPERRSRERCAAWPGSASTTITTTCPGQSWVLDLLDGARPAVRVQQLAGAAAGGAGRRGPRGAALLSGRRRSGAAAASAPSSRRSPPINGCWCIATCALCRGCAR